MMCEQCAEYRQTIARLQRQLQEALEKIPPSGGMADAEDLKSSGCNVRRGSTPLRGTNLRRKRKKR